MAVSQQNQPQEPRINGGRSGQPAISSRTTPAATTTMSEEMNMASKRQRRPSVRLVEIGDQPAAAITKQLRPISRVSKTRVLTNLGGFDEGEKENKSERGDFESDNVSIGSWRIKGPKPKRDLKRPRTNRVSKKVEDEDGRNNDNVEEDGNGFSRDFEIEGSESPLKEQEQNPEHDLLDDERDLQFRANHGIRSRIGDDGVDLDVQDDDNGGQNSARRWGGEVDGIKAWLEGLGLSRYSPVFEFHEVDEDVLPLLTLEDLKDMGINAVGSRRKIFCAIQKLNKGFS